MTSVGVLSGGVSRGELLEAGARGVFENAEDLGAHLDESPVATLLSRVGSDGQGNSQGNSQGNA